MTHGRGYALVISSDAAVRSHARPLVVSLRDLYDDGSLGSAIDTDYAKAMENMVAIPVLASIVFHFDTQGDALRAFNALVDSDGFDAVVDIAD